LQVSLITVEIAVMCGWLSTAVGEWVSVNVSLSYDLPVLSATASFLLVTCCLQIGVN